MPLTCLVERGSARLVVLGAPIHRTEQHVRLHDLNARIVGTVE